jgi:PAS domain S-box-containing protein
VSLEELRVADEELREQNEELMASRDAVESQRHHYHDLFNLAPVGYLLTDRDGTIRESNQAAAKLLNVRLTYLIGKPLAIFVPEEHRAAFRQWLVESNSVDTVRVWETFFQPRHSAEKRDILLTITHVANNSEAQRDVRFRWLLYDITDRKKAEAEERENYFHETFERAAVGIAHTDRNGHYLRVNHKICEMLGYTREELLQLSTFDITVPDDINRSRELLRQLIDGGLDSVAFDKRYRRKDGSVIWVHLTVSGVFDTKGNYAYSISVLNDVTENKRLMAAELEQRTLADAVRKTATILTSTLNFEEVLDHIVETIGLIVPYDGASILLAEVDPLDAHIERGWGDIVDIISQWEHVLRKLKVRSTGQNVLNQVVSTHMPFIIPDLENDIFSKIGVQIDTICSLIIVPIIARDVIIGYVELHKTSSNFFTEQHSHHLQIFASQAAVAIQNARAYKQGQSLAALEERQRLARDLHDAVTQTLFTSSVISEALLRVDKDKPEKIWSHLNTLHTLNRGAMAEMRTLLIELRPEYMLKLPLTTQLQQLIDAVKSRKQIDIQLTINEDKGKSIPTDVQVVFYRIMQEALNNIVKHSGASEVEVVFNNLPMQIVLSISDNGVGFNVEASIDSLGMGMTNMRERANSIHSQLQISSSIGKGSQIILSWFRES